LQVQAESSRLHITIATNQMKRFVRYPKEETDTFLIIVLFLSLCFLAISAFT
jgi:hypothetical protein